MREKTVMNGGGALETDKWVSATWARICGKYRLSSCFSLLPIWMMFGSSAL